MIDGEIKRPKIRAGAGPRFAYQGKAKWSKNTLLGRPLKRLVSGTVDTAFRGRRRAKRVRLRKLQRQARKLSR